jgi:hypothetical protein
MTPCGDPNHTVDGISHFHVIKEGLKAASPEEASLESRMWAKSRETVFSEPGNRAQATFREGDFAGTIPEAPLTCGKQVRCCAAALCFSLVGI